MSGPKLVCIATAFPLGRTLWPHRVTSTTTIRFAEGRHGRHASGTRHTDVLCQTLQAGQNVRSGHQENDTIIVSPEKRLLVLEALGQTEAERKYERAPPHGHGTRATRVSGKSAEDVKIMVWRHSSLKDACNE